MVSNVVGLFELLASWEGDSSLAAELPINCDPVPVPTSINKITPLQASVADQYPVGAIPAEALHG